MTPESGAVVENPLVKTSADNPFGGDFPGPRSRASRANDGGPPPGRATLPQDRRPGDASPESLPGTGGERDEPKRRHE